MSNYDPIPRGKCSLCKDYVWSDQRRTKDNGIYRHHRCPRRMGGLLKEINKHNRLLARRASYYDRYYKKNLSKKLHLLSKIKVYLSLPEPRLPIRNYKILQRRMGGLVNEKDEDVRMFARRTSYYKSEMITKKKIVFYDQHLLYGFKIYLSLPEPRLPIRAYRIVESTKFRWNIDYLRQCSVYKK